MFGFAQKKSAPSQGKQAEIFAKKYLAERGLRCITENYHCRFGEIDIIAEEQNTLVFVEVRYRSNPQYGSALASVTLAKQQKIRLAAQHYLSETNTGESRPMRFDVVGISPNEVDWIQNAF